MNNKRREKLRCLSHELSDAMRGQTESLSKLSEKLEDLLSEEQAYFDSIPKNLHSGPRACDSNAAIEALGQALSLLEEALSSDDDNNITSLTKEAVALIEEAAA